MHSPSHHCMHIYKPAARNQASNPAMKEANFHSSPIPPSSLLPKGRSFITIAPTFLVFLALGYILGFLTASSSSSSSNPPPSHQPLIQSQPTLLKEPDKTEASTPPPHDLLWFRTECAEAVAASEIRKTILENIYEGVDPFEGFPSAETAELLLPAAAQPRGWGSQNGVFAELVASVRPRTIIELGTFLGASALHMAGLARNLSLPTLIVCVDDFRGWPGFRRRLARDVPRPRHGDALLLPQFMAGVRHAGEAARVLPLPFSTGSALAALCEWGVYGDLIEVDAGHDFHSAWADINMAWAVLRPGGTLFGHDYHTRADHMGVRRAVTLFAKVNGLTVRGHGQHWVLSPKPQPH